MATITESTNNIFTAPPLSILLHACNCRGSWGAGVAAAFKSRYPNAYDRYHTHCTTAPAGTKVAEHQASLLGTCLLIPPCEDEGREGKEGRDKHWIACLFTSVGYGRGTSSQKVILEKTGEAVGDLRGKIEEVKKGGNGVGVGAGAGGREEVGEIWGVRINSGMFGVQWEKTLEVLEEAGLDMRIVRPEEEEAKDEGKNRSGKGKREGDAEGSKTGGGGGRGGGSKRVKRGGLDGWLK